MDSALSQLLYLDTARLGQVSPSAKRAITGALEFNQALGASAYFDEVLFAGSDSLKIASQFDGMSLWPGIERFSEEIKETIFGTNVGDVVFASRTGSLMALASKMMFARCSNVLTTDLNWQPFTELFSAATLNANFQISKVDIKDLLFNRQISKEELAETIASAFSANRCDGIFLPAVCNLGVKLPAPEIVAAIKRVARLRFSVVDAAQAINHVDLGWAKENVDFTFGGTHKWLKAYEPMAIGYSGKTGSRSFIRETVNRELATNPIADPLLRVTQLNAAQKSETVNLCPLFAAAGALSDAKTEIPNSGTGNARSSVLEIAARTGWDCFPLSPEFRSRILMLRKSPLKNANPGMIRKTLIRLGVAVTDYPNGLCRISLPEMLGERQADQLESALGKVA